MPKSTAIKAGYAKKLGGVDFDLYPQIRHLLSLFIADQEIKKMVNKEDLRYLEAFWNSDEDIVNLLVELATKYRMTIWNVEESDRSIHFGNEVVGVIREDGKNDEDLYIRSACDKIIHAERIIFDVTKLRGIHDHYLNPFIHINGKRGKRKWEVIIDILSFCNALCRPVQKTFEELTSGSKSE